MRKSAPVAAINALGVREDETLGHQRGSCCECDRSEALRLRRPRRTTLGIVTGMGGDAQEEHGRVFRGDWAAPGATRLDPDPKGTYKILACRSQFSNRIRLGSGSTEGDLDDER
jgi:hypothetical protein